MRLALVLCALVALSFSAQAGWHHCWYVPAPEVTLPANGSVYYVDNDLCQLVCLSSLWIYEETNGIDGLQRDDPMWAPCPLIAADTIVASVFA